MSADSFAAAFDSIEIDSARAASPAAIEAAMAMCAPADQPGFYLLDDSDGRFVVDREFGFISLKDDATLVAERSQVHAARLKVVEHSGVSYELVLRLRISGRVPQVVADAAEDPAAAPVEPVVSREIAPIAWDKFAAGLGGRARPIACEEDAPFGALGDADWGAEICGDAELHLDAALPLPAPSRAAWAL